MAIGFTPKYIELYPLADLPAAHFIALGVEAAIELGWKVASASDAGFIAYTNNGIFSFNAEIEVKIEGTEVQLKSSSTGNEMIDFGKNRRIIRKFMDKFHALQPTFSSEHLNIQYKEIERSFVSEDQDLLKLPPATAKENFYGFLALFKPAPGYFITPILININLLVFLAMACTGVNIIEPDNASMLAWGANFKPLTLEGGWWRLVTNCFLHFGIFHLLLNMYALSYIGLLLEPFLGKTRFIAAYLSAGVAASLTSLWWHDYTISAGASGAVFGMYGVFLALLSTNLIEKETRKPLLISIGVFVAYNLMYGLKGGIDNAAHIGGLLSGLVFGYAYVPGILHPEKRQLDFGVSLSILLCTFCISYTCYYGLPKSALSTYQESFKKFGPMEALALDFYNLPDSTSKEDKLYSIKDRGIYYWNENIKLLNELETLDLPEALHQRDQKLKAYCELRIKTYNLLYKAISEDTDKYKQQMEQYGQELNSLLTELSNN